MDVFNSNKYLLPLDDETIKCTDINRYLPIQEVVNILTTRFRFGVPFFAFILVEIFVLF